MAPRANVTSCCILLVGVLMVVVVLRWSIGATDAGPTVIVVPGGGLLEDGTLPLHSLKRVEKAVELFRADPHSVIIALSAGTTHKPNPRDAEGFPLYESSVALKYLVDKGVPVQNLLEEKMSLDTIGNAFFLRAIHLDIKKTWKNVVVITNEWHMKRTKAIFDTVFGLPSTAKAKNSYVLDFVSVENALPADILAVRQKRETESLKTFLTQTKHLWQDFSELHNWMFLKHTAYGAIRYATDTREKLSIEEAKSY